MITILLIVLLILVIGGLPTWQYPWQTYGYYPSGILGILLIVLVVLLLTGRL